MVSDRDPKMDFIFFQRAVLLSKVRILQNLTRRSGATAISAVCLAWNYLSGDLLKHPKKNGNINRCTDFIV